jgi:hypothetical protein
MTSESPAVQALASGLADYYPCSFRNDPDFAPIAVAYFRKRGASTGGRGLRDLRNRRQFESTISPHSYHRQGEVWAAAFWELRESAIGKSATDRLLLEAWRRTSPEDAKGDLHSRFAANILSADGGANAAIIRDVFARRGVKLR